MQNERPSFFRAPIDKYVEQKKKRKQSSEISQSLLSEVSAADLAVEALAICAPVYILP
jgi:hypothetical protein